MICCGEDCASRGGCSSRTSCGGDAATANLSAGAPGGADAEVVAPSELSVLGFLGFLGMIAQKKIPTHYAWNRSPTTRSETEFSAQQFNKGRLPSQTCHGCRHTTRVPRAKINSKILRELRSNNAINRLSTVVWPRLPSSERTIARTKTRLDLQ
jgi:hypothetical protein